MLQVLSSIPFNRLDLYNPVYVSELTNTVALGTTDGVLFLQVTFETSVQNAGAEDGVASSVTEHTMMANPVLSVKSFAKIDVQLEDPISLAKPSLIGGLVGSDAELYYYDRFLSQVVAPSGVLKNSANRRKRQRTTPMSISKLLGINIPLTASNSGQMFSTEIVVALSSGGGWYACGIDAASPKGHPVWNLICGWKALYKGQDAPILAINSANSPQKTSAFLEALHNICCSDIALGTFNDGHLILYHLDGNGRISVLALDITSRTVKFVSKPAPLQLDQKVTAITHVNVSNGVECLACGCPDGRIYLLIGISPSTAGDERESFTYQASQQIWTYVDIPVDSLVYYSTNNTLFATKCGFITAWRVTTKDSGSEISISSPIFTQVDKFPILSLQPLAAVEGVNSYLATSESAMYKLSLSSEGKFSSQRLASNDTLMSQTTTRASAVSGNFEKSNTSFFLHAAAPVCLSSGLYVAVLGAFESTSVSSFTAPKFLVQFLKDEASYDRDFARRAKAAEILSWGSVILALSGVSNGDFFKNVDSADFWHNTLPIEKLWINYRLLMAQPFVGQKSDNVNFSKACTMLRKELLRRHVVSMYAKAKFDRRTISHFSVEGRLFLRCLFEACTNLGIEKKKSDTVDCPLSNCPVCAGSLLLSFDENSASFVYTCASDNAHFFSACSRSFSAEQELISYCLVCTEPEIALTNPRHPLRSSPELFQLLPSSCVFCGNSICHLP